MTDTDPAPAPQIVPARKSFRDRFSLVWFVPIGALLVSLGVVYQTYADRGPVIEIAFANASGIKADETELRFRDVPVGLVEAVRFSDRLANVVVEVRLDKAIAPYVDADAQFWVVRPEVTAQGVTGLDTVLSGAFIEGSWNDSVDAPQEQFTGSDRAPLVRSGQDGIAFVLRSSDGEGLSEGTPILYRGIAVGSVANLRLAEDGLSVLADAFVRAPEDRLVTTATRFWDTSGFSFSFGAQGAQLDVSSLASLVSGGVAFDTIVSGGEQVAGDEVFQLFVDEASARNSVFSESDAGTKLDLALIFEGSVSGLAAGAAVEFQGINVGTVTAITGVVDPERFGDNVVRLLATIQLNPGKMGLSRDTSEEAMLDFLDEAVARGLRAQLQNASILTGGLKVALLVPDRIGPQLPEAIDRDGEPYPILPTVPANLSDFTDTAEGVFNRINELPIEELLGSAINVMDSVNRLLNDDGTTRTPAEVLALIGEIRGLVGSDEVRAIPVQAGTVLASLQASVDSLDALLQSARDAGAVESLTAALDAAREAADAVSLAVADVPALIVSIQEVSASADTLMTTANELPLAELLIRAETLLDSVDTLVNAPATQALPFELGQAIAEARGAVADLRASGVVAQVSATLTSTQDAVTRVTDALLPVIEQAQTTIAGVNASLDGLPGLITELQGVATGAQVLMTTANALPLNELLTQASAVIVSADAILNDPGTRALPGQLGAAVAEAQGVIADVRAAGLIDGAGATLDQTSAAVTRVTDALLPVIEQAQTAIAGVNRSLDGVPALVAQLERVAGSADALIVKATALPLEDLVVGANGVIASADAILADPATRALPGQLGAAVAEAQGVIADVRTSGLIDGAGATIESANAAVTRVSDALLPVIEQAQTAIAGVNASLDGVPALISGLEDVADNANGLIARASALPLEEMLTQANGVIVSANALLNDDATRALPGQLGAAVDAARAAIEDVRVSGLIDNADATLDSAQAAATRITEALLPVLESARQAADSLSAATTDLPRIVQRADAIAAQIEELATTAADLPLEDLVARAGALIDSANALVASEDTQGVPGALNDALTQIEGVLADIRSRGVIDNVNRTLVATEQAAGAVAQATTQLPGLVSRMNALLAEAESVVGGYRADGRLGAEARSALGDIRDAAKSVSSLARAIERAPNSLLFGR